MIQRTSNEFRFSFILNLENFGKLIEFLKKHYNNLFYSINLINGDQIDLSYEELTGYENYSDERIIGIKISGVKDETNIENIKYIYSDDSIEISIGDNSGYVSIFEKENISYHIKSTNSAECKELKEGLNKIFKNEFKSNYSFADKSGVYYIIIMLLILGVSFYLTKNYFSLNNEKIFTTYLLAITMYFFLLIIFTNGIYKKIHGFLFPKAIFGVGKQKELVLKKEEYRKNIFRTVLVGGILSILLTIFF